MSLSLTSCNESNSSSTSNNNQPPINSSSSNQDIPSTTIKDWKSEDKQLMNDLLNETIPVAPLTDNYVCLQDSDENGDYIYIYDESSMDVSAEYGTILLSQQYISEGSEYGYDYYSKMINDTDYIVLQVGYFQGDSEYSASMDIFAWLESSSVNPDDIITSWDEELLSLMQNILKMTLPVAPISTNYTFTSYIDIEDDEIVYINDAVIGNIVDEYGAILENNDFAYIEGDEQYSTYLYSLSTTQAVYIQINFDQTFGFEIYAWADIDDTTYFDTWPAEEITNGLNGIELTIPAYELTDQYGFALYDLENSSFMISIYSVTITAVAEYTNILKAANWTMITETTNDCVALDPSNQYTLEYWFEESETTFYIYFDNYGTAPILSWPTEQINDFVTSDVIIPTFDASSYMVYLESSYLMISATTDSIDSEQVYINILVENNWTIDSSAYETDGHLAKDPTNQVLLTFYFSDGQLVIFIENIIEIKNSISIDPSHFTTTGYADNNGTKVINDINFSCYNVMNQAQKVQIKKETGKLYNLDALDLVSIQLVENNGNILVYGCTSAGDIENGKLIAADENGNYNLIGYQYFSLCGGTGVGIASSIIISLA